MDFRLELNGRIHSLTVLARRPKLVVAVDGRPSVVDGAGAAGEGRLTLVIDGRAHRVARADTADGAVVRVRGRDFPVRLVGASGEAGASGDRALRAPMPGVVVSVHTAAGDAVRRGETIVVIESMKLQTYLAAPGDGVVAEVAVRPGDGFDKGAVLVRFAAAVAAE